MRPTTISRAGIFALLAIVATSATAQVSLTTLGVPYTQNFDALPASGSTTWTNTSTIPGWFHARTGTGTTIVANDGSSNAGNLYSFGTGTNAERALGSVGSGNAAVGNMFWGVRLQNNTGTTITQLDIAYTGEQWRNSAAAAQTIAFSYLVGSPTVTGSLAEFQNAGVAVTALNFTSPITGGAAAALNGNLAANRTAIAFSITGLSIPNGTEVMLRWSDPDQTGADHGLSIDDFSVTPQGAAPQPDLTINDVTLGEGDSGTTTFTFTVSLSAPAPADVSFDIATADDTATVVDGDYLANSATGQTIATGQQSADFSVAVNGDDKYEPNGQQFFVNVTNVTGANVTDAQGVGTITDDDTYPTLSATAATSVIEGNAGNPAATITYTLSNPADQDTTVTVSTADGTATLADGDYVQLSGATLVIPAGDTTFDYTGAMAVGDVAVESNEDFTVAVDDYLVGPLDRAPKGVTLPAPTVVTIVNDDASADLSIAVTDSPDPVVQGQDLTYVVTLTNAGPSNADGANFTLDLPAGTTFVSLAQPGMWNCTTPAVGANGSVSCNDGVVTAPQGAAKMGVGSAQFTIVANVPMSVLPGTVLTADLSSSAMTADPNGQNNATIAATTVAAALSPSVPVPTLDPRMLAVLALLVAGIAATSLRRTH
jgi:uncharacterized repeat protein (TIGR01451 family)